jgi:hypothetical protein
MSDRAMVKYEIKHELLEMSSFKKTGFIRFRVLDPAVKTAACVSIGRNTQISLISSRIAFSM